jgi:hypothetical protein
VWSGKGSLWQFPEGRSTSQKAAVRDMSKCHEIIPGDQYNQCKMIPGMRSVVDHLEHIDVSK